MKMGLSDAVMVDRQGAIYKGRDNLNFEKAKMAEISNKGMNKGSLGDVIQGADVFIGVSSAGIVTEEMVKSMASKAILFPMANPTPEIMPDKALAAGAALVGTGRSDFANQINNVLAFPGIFRGALDVRARDINDEMKIAAACAIAGLISDNELKPDNILPAAFDPRVREAVAKAVGDAARKTGVSRI
jgi:malate dehydrogenase (oxaloacetate-decarboxylating)